MAGIPNPFNTLEKLDETNLFYSLPKLEKEGVGKISRLPVSIRILLESVLRHCDGVKITENEVRELANWDGSNPGEGEVPFTVSRVILQDFTGVPLLVDLAAMRDAVADKGAPPELIEPLVPVDLVVDHSVQVDRAGTQDSFLFNLEEEFRRNKERYAFLKWGQGAFETLNIVPPGIGIVHQVNLELIATLIKKKQVENGTLLYPDTLVGTDSHTTMINGLGVVGWGVGGIEAEAAMLGQPVFIQTPEVIGFHMSGALREGVTATDLTLRVTEILRKKNVVGKFVEFFGEGTASLSVADRATIGNMSPEYGATMGFFPADEKTMDYLAMTGREQAHIDLVRRYLKAQGLFGIPKQGEADYTDVVELDLSTVAPSLAGPKRPQDRIALPEVKKKFQDLFVKPAIEGGYGKGEEELSRSVSVHSNGKFHSERPHETGGASFLDHTGREPRWSEAEMVTNRPVTNAPANPGYTENKEYDEALAHGSVVIAAITSCTNTSNPDVMVGAGLVAKKAVERGLKIHSSVKTSLAPGSRVVTDYLEKAGLTPYLNELGFQLVAYGCTTCIGNSGPLDETIESAIKEHDLICASVLSGNRNFEARIHSAVKANFLMSPPLVVAFALAGRIDIDLDHEPVGNDSEGTPVFLKEIWPTADEIAQTVKASITPEMYRDRYSRVDSENPVWQKIESATGSQYDWKEDSTYIRQPPYFENFSLDLPPVENLEGMVPLAIFGDSVTTDHISPAGAFSPGTPAGGYLEEHGVEPKNFNSYGSRRGNHEVMMRGTFANVRIRNLMAGGREGGYTMLRDRIKTTCTLSEGCDAPSAAQNSSGIGALTIPSSFCTASEASRSSESVQFISIRSLMPEGKEMPIFKASKIYREKNIPLIVIAGKDYGMGSSRDWAAKGTRLLGVKVVIAESFERIHRSNLIGMGVLPLQFKEGDSASSLKITGEETFSLKGLFDPIKPGQKAHLEIKHAGGDLERVEVLVRLDTPIEVEYYKHGGIMPYVLRQALSGVKSG